MKFEERLKEKMKEKGLSQIKLAIYCGCSQPTISEYLHGKKTPSETRIQKIAEALECDVEWLKGNDEVVKEPVNYSRSDVYRGDIFYVKMSNRVYDTGVIDAGRPAVVVSNNQGNYHSGYVQVVYLTTREKKPLPTHVPIICKVPSTAMCEQIQTVSKDRLVEFVRTCTEKEMEQIDEALKISLGLEVLDTTKVVDENKELKLYLKEAREDLLKEQESKQRIAKEYDSLKVKHEELMEESNSTEDYESAEVLKLKAERDVYKLQYEALLERLIGK